MKKKVAIFDIDGTIFRSSLLIEVTDALIAEGLFSESIKKVYAESYRNWHNRKDSYEKYIGDVVKAFDKNIEICLACTISRLRVFCSNLS